LVWAQLSAQKKPCEITFAIFLLVYYATQKADDSLLVRGPTVDTTLKEAKNLKAELIVVGAHGHGAVYDVLIGSYSAGIIRKSTLPVLVVPIRDS